MNKDYVISLQGKEFVKYEGLLALFHENGGSQITTKLISTELNGETFFVFRATVSGDRGAFDGYGDACKANVNSMVVKHMMRMAETRAKARALRDYNNIGMCSVEELGGE